VGAEKGYEVGEECATIAEGLGYEDGFAGSVQATLTKWKYMQNQEGE